MSLETRKRKRKICIRCLGEEEWIGEKWESKVQSFKALGQQTESKLQRVRKNQNHHLTKHQRQALLSLFYDDEGVCSLCARCFTQFTGESLYVRKSLSTLIRDSNFSRSDFLLNVDLLSHGNSKKSSNSSSLTVHS